MRAQCSRVTKIDGSWRRKRERREGKFTKVQRDASVFAARQNNAAKART